MKGSSLPAKRGWRGLVLAVLGLVILSMLVPLVFLLGLHNGFHSGYVPEDRNSASSASFEAYNAANREKELNRSEEEKMRHLDLLLQRFGPSFDKGGLNSLESSVKEADNKTTKSSDIKSDVELQGPPNQTSVLMMPHPVGGAIGDLTQEKKNSGTIYETTEPLKGGISEEADRSCQLEFGSYCLWCKEHKEEMKDSMVKRLKDQLFVARAYYPSIAKLPALAKLSRELKQNIQELERILSEATTDPDLPAHVEKKLQNMEAAVAKAKSYHVDCNNVDRKLRQILDLTVDEAHFHMKQSAFLFQLASQTMPKSLHCLSMRLTVEYFRSQSAETEFSESEKHDNPDLFHYVIFSKNLLASTVVVNSTVMHAEESEKLVFHLLTDGENYAAMKHWFFMNSFKKATIRVLNIEDLNLNYFSNPVTPGLLSSEEFRVSIRSADMSGIHARTKYISVFSHLQFELPEIFKKLRKVVVLDDDVVVRRDLSPLWSLNLEGKINGAVEFCGVRLGQLKGYFGEYGFDNNACVWMSGLNVIDLEKWREQNLTQTFRRWLELHKQQSETSFRAGALPASLITFRDMIYALDGSWVLSGLGYDYGIRLGAIKNAAVLHYNGNMKPWLELGIPKYKRFWKKFLKRDDQFMDECNVNP